jgi:predicted ATPase
MEMEMDAMYTSFTIENFRLFDRLTVGPLARVNLIAGDNNAGKTALLEALWIHANPINPRRAANIGRERGLSSTQQSSLFEDWFPGYQTDLPIRLEATWKRDASRVLNIKRRDRTDSAQLLLPTSQESDFDEENIADFDYDHEVAFEYVDETGYKVISSAWLDEELTSSLPRLSIERNESVPPQRIRCEFVRTRNRQRHLQFSAIERRGSRAEIEEIVRLIEPKLRALTLISSERGLPSIYGDIGMGALLPIALMGDGANRLLDLALAFLPARNGIILVDEIENGIHHSRLESVWKYLDQMSRRFNVQVFATTHSRECIAAAVKAFDASESMRDLNYIRLQRDKKTGQCRSIQFDDKESLKFAMSYPMEVR